MPHSPPVPPGNQSPYPRGETTHEDADTAGMASNEDADSASGQEAEGRSPQGGLTTILGIGAVGALVAGLVAFTRSTDAEATSGKKAKRSKD
jgi:hypothetical protein